MSLWIQKNKLSWKVTIISVFNLKVTSSEFVSAKRRHFWRRLAKISSFNVTYRKYKYNANNLPDNFSMKHASLYDIPFFSALVYPFPTLNPKFHRKIKSKPILLNRNFQISPITNSNSNFTNTHCLCCIFHYIMLYSSLFIVYCCISHYLLLHFILFVAAFRIISCWISHY